MTTWPKGMEPKQPPRNQQPAEKPTVNKFGYLEVHSIWPTIQGEGPYAGRGAIFIRLAGCNLQCPWCDTEYTSIRKKMNPMDIVTEVARYNGDLVVLTGGEPFRQDINRAVRALLISGQTIQIETNGTLYLDDFPYSKVTIVCSPKTATINSRIKIDAYKYVLDSEYVDPNDGLPTSALGMPTAPARPREVDLVSGVPIYVQPMDTGDPERNADNVRVAVESAMRFGYLFCPQIHKLAGMP